MTALKTPDSHIAENEKLSELSKKKSPAEKNSISARLIKLGNQTNSTVTMEQDRSNPEPEVLYDEVQTPRLFEKTFAVAADPWMQDWQELNNTNWKQYLNKIARECGLKSFQHYKVKFSQVF